MLVDVFPAWAGMNRRSHSQSRSQSRVPRVGGDEPPGDLGGYIAGMCSPRGRG